MRRHIRKIDAGAAAPARVSPGSKLDAYAERITELSASGRTASQLGAYVVLREEPRSDRQDPTKRSRVHRAKLCELESGHFNVTFSVADRCVPGREYQATVEYVEMLEIGA